MKRCCCYCSEEFEAALLRPYGPDGADSCFPCAMSTSERMRVAKQGLGATLGAHVTDTGIVTVRVHST